MKEMEKPNKLWMARDADGSLWLYWGKKPELREESGNYIGEYCMLWENPWFTKRKTDFPEVTNESGPVEVEVLITILKK